MKKIILMLLTLSTLLLGKEAYKCSITEVEDRIQGTINKLNSKYSIYALFEIQGKKLIITGSGYNPITLKESFVDKYKTKYYRNNKYNIAIDENFTNVNILEQGFLKELNIKFGNCGKVTFLK